MKTKLPRSLGGVAGVVLLVAGCTAAPPPSPPPPPAPPPAIAACAETATIALWVENGQHKARVYGNGSGAEEKNLFVDGEALTAGASEICWDLVAVPPARVSDVLWVHVKDFGQPIFPGNGQFDPNLNRRHRLLYGQHPAAWPETVPFPPGSGQTFAAARVAYKVWIKLQGGSPPFEADPDLVIIKPRG